LVNSDCDLKICDFGLSTVKKGAINKNFEMTNYVVTRWFRAPEILVGYGAKDYTEKIDMWSVGCVLGEIFLKKVLFGEKNLAG
jgi:serine/threonine protein kinase